MKEGSCDTGDKLVRSDIVDNNAQQTVPGNVPAMVPMGSALSMPKSVRKVLVGLAFCSPWLVGFLVFGLYPFAMSLYDCFTNFNILQAPQWVGLQNYIQMVHDQLFWQSVYNTLYITVIGVPLSIVLGIAQP